MQRGELGWAGGPGPPAANFPLPLTGSLTVGPSPPDIPAALPLPSVVLCTGVRSSGPSTRGLPTAPVELLTLCFRLRSDPTCRCPGFLPPFFPGGRVS